MDPKQIRIAIFCHRVLYLPSLALCVCRFYGVVREPIFFPFPGATRERNLVHVASVDSSHARKSGNSDIRPRLETRFDPRPRYALRVSVPQFNEQEASLPTSEPAVACCMARALGRFETKREYALSQSQRGGGGGERKGEWRREAFSKAASESERDRKTQPFGRSVGRPLEATRRPTAAAELIRVDG